MTREKVVEGLKHCKMTECDGCPYVRDGDSEMACSIRVRNDALALLDVPATRAREIAEAVKPYKLVIERDRTAVASAVSHLLEVIRGYHWLTEGRGPYAYDDNRWHQEIARAFEAIREAAKPLQIIGGDMSNSPTAQDEVARARALLDRPEASRG